MRLIARDAVIIPFRHRPASTDSRAASCASNSAVTPASLARGMDKIAVHQRDGILSLVSHLRAAKMLTPRSEAIASAEGHKPTIPRKDVGDMSSTLRRNVEKIKP